VRLVLISDIHEDILSLKNVLKQVDKKGYDHLFCLGDISGFSVPYYKYRKTRNAHECLTLIREKCDIILPGNHDLHAARKIPGHSDVFDFPLNWYEMDYHEKKSLAGEEIWLHEENELDPLYSGEDIKFLGSLPEYATFSIPSCNILLSHYVYPNLSGFKKGFYSEADEFRSHFELMTSLHCSISFTGHAHVNGFYAVNRKKFRQFNHSKHKLNHFPVCIGIPPVTSNKKRTGFCIFDTESMNVRAVGC
jgi:predicted phosphodiesterase